MEIPAFLVGKQVTDTVYLHLRPEVYYNSLRGMNVTKMAKSRDAAVDPRDYVVKLEVVVPSEFFEQATPSARVVLEPSAVVPILVAQEEDSDDAG